MISRRWRRLGDLGADASSLAHQHSIVCGSTTNQRALAECSDSPSLRRTLFASIAASLLLEDEAKSRRVRVTVSFAAPFFSSGAEKSALTLLLFAAPHSCHKVTHHVHERTEQTQARRTLSPIGGAAGGPSFIGGALGTRASTGTVPSIGGALGMRIRLGASGIAAPIGGAVGTRARPGDDIGGADGMRASDGASVPVLPAAALVLASRSRMRSLPTVGADTSRSRKSSREPSR
mgnify:CR=1 FL=1